MSVSSDPLQAIALPAGIRYITNQLAQVNQATLQTSAIAAHVAYIVWDKYGTLITPAINLAVRLWGLQMTLEAEAASLSVARPAPPAPGVAGPESQNGVAAPSAVESNSQEDSHQSGHQQPFWAKWLGLELALPALSWASFFVDGIAILPHFYAWQCTLRKNYLESTMNNLSTPPQVAAAAFQSHQALRPAFAFVKAITLPLHYGSTLLSISQLLYALHQMIILRRTGQKHFYFSVLVPVNAFSLLTNLAAISRISLWA